MATNEQPEKNLKTDDHTPRAPLSAPPRQASEKPADESLLESEVVAIDGTPEDSSVRADSEVESSGENDSDYQSDDVSEGDAQKQQPPRSAHVISAVEWQAPEYIHHDKGTTWYAALGVLTLIGAATAFFFSQWLFALLIVVMGLALGMIAKRPPRDINYRIDDHGVTVGEKTFPFSQLKAFGVLGEGDIYTVLIRPAKRFMPSVTLYFKHDDGEKIFDALAANLPAEEVKPDIFDKFVKRLRF